MRRTTAPLTALLAAGFLLAGCATGPGGTVPSSSPAPGALDEPTTPHAEPGAAWLDGGRMFAVVTYGSSSCVPVVADVSADGQTVQVALEESADEDTVCTADYGPRASVGAVPDSVDPTEDVALVVTSGDAAFEIELDGDDALAGTGDASTDYGPSAGWIDDGVLVLLTWGSSTCPPVVESVEGSGGAGTITFAEPDAEQVCTMDMAPRATLAGFGDDVDEDDFQLTIVGADIEATIPVRG